MNYKSMVEWLRTKSIYERELIYEFTRRSDECGFVSIEDLLQKVLEPKVRGMNKKKFEERIKQ